MKLEVSRRTGFYGMATPIEVLKSGERWFIIANNTTKTLEIDEDVELQVRFYFMKSKPIQIKNDANEKELEIIMNPILISNYLVFFFLMFLIPIAGMALWAVFVFLLLYFAFLFSTLRKAYVIKEKMNGT